MEIEKLLEQPESKTLEFKKDTSSLLPILKTCVAFANTAGGTLIIGRSPEGTIDGLEDVFKVEEQLANAIADSIFPPLLPEIEIATIKGKNLIVLKVAHWKGPFCLKKLGTPNGVFIRLGSTSRPAGPELLAELQRSVLHLSFDEQPVADLSLKNLDLEKVKQSFQKIGRDLDEEKMRSLGIIVPVAKRFSPSIGGLILFGKQTERQQYIPDARVSCARFLGNDKVEILDRFDIEGSILDAVDAVPKFIARNTRLAAEIRGMQREDISEYPPVGIREVLINALVHSDYSLTGSRIQVAIFDDRLEIQNPGMLPFGFTLEDLKQGVSRVRNRVIARVFSELRLMEAWGSGYKRIVEACRSGGYPEPEWKELGASLRVTFFPHPKTFLERTQKAISSTEELLPRQISILSQFSEADNLSFRQIMEKLHLSISERSLRYDLAHLKNLGLLIPKGKGRATIWHRR